MRRELLQSKESVNERMDEMDTRFDEVDRDLDTTLKKMSSISRNVAALKSWSDQTVVASSAERGELEDLTAKK